MRVELGATGMRISRLGLGTWAFGCGGWPHGWGRQEDADSVATIRHAVKVGLNWIDTAAVYGRGHAEEVVGRALRDLPDGERPYVFTKAGRQWEEGDLSKLHSILTRATLRADVEGSLRRLGVDRLDLLQVHWPASDGAPVEEYSSHLAELRDEGKVRAIGLSNHWLDQLARADATAPVDTVQLPLSLLRTQASKEAAWCHAGRAGFLAYSPLQSGLLSGRMSRERVDSFPEDDWRRRSPDFAAERVDANLAAASALAGAAEQRGVTTSALAIALVLAGPGVSGAIVGARNPSQMEDLLGAAEIELPGEAADSLAGEVAVAASRAAHPGGDR